MKRLAAAILGVLALAGSGIAGDFDLEFATTIANDEFKTVVREVGMIGAYRAVAPAEPGGLTGFDVGVEASAVEIDTSSWDKAISDFGDAPDYVVVPRLHVRKGLPFNLDVGASYTQVVDSDVSLIGAEIQWAILEGTVATPALALRGHYSTLLGVDELDLTTYGADAVVSKGFAMFTPYAGLGVVRIEGEYAGDDAILKTTLQDQDMTEVRYFAGLQTSLALLRLTLEAEYSEFPIYTAKVSLGW